MVAEGDLVEEEVLLHIHPVVDIVEVTEVPVDGDMLLIKR